MTPEPLVRTAQADAAVLRAVERAMGELRRGDPVLLSAAGGGAALVLAAEQAREDTLERLRQASGTGPLLLLPARRAGALGLDRAAAAGDVVALNAVGVSAPALLDLADPAGTAAPRVPRVPPALPAPPALAEAAVDLIKLARLLPAAVLAPLALAGPDLAAWAAAHDILRVEESDVADYRFAGMRTLTQVAEARLPLAGAENARVVAFRPGDGGKAHLAIVIGEPAPGQAALIRVHSECFTGDLLGSLRCDCGDQLRGAVEAIAAAGAGILLYLSQEGRGIGLVNKLRAYRVQDRGADTAEANEALGFDADERVYMPAAEMLHRLGIRRVRLLTNNPHKVAALARCGIAVDERVPHAFPANGHNEFYLATKAARFGHQL